MLRIPSTKRRRLYDVWKEMIKRCYKKENKSYKTYGAKGIKVDDDWHDYTAFYKWALPMGYKESLCLDRMNPNKGYEPNNCRWIRREESNALRFNVDTRKTCKRGHPWKKETTYFFSSGTKTCKICVLSRKKLKYIQDSITPHDERKD